MAKLTWGTKRTCPSCGARFYDLRRSSVVCPKCDTPYRGEINVKPKRTRVPAEAARQVREAVVIAAAAEPKKELGASSEVEKQELGDKELEAIGNVETGKEEDLIEDPSELGEDADDVAGVIDNVGGKEEA
ncbi:MAG: TIGR02300 family protein [Proteobacteria bacterium]|nr:TIGR02300 family protein [Pseudomonadota bacterium]